MVSIIYANNEVGTLNRISELAAECRRRGIPFHTDAVQAGAYLSVDVDLLGVDLLSLGGHKFYGPKGVGALYVRQGTPMIATQAGGGQEFGLRAGTQNVPYIVGFAEALGLVQSKKEAEVRRLLPLRDALITGVLEGVSDSALTGHPAERLPNHASFVLAGVDGNALLAQLDQAGFACSSGSACKTGSPEPSDVLQALGYAPQWSLGSLRVTLGEYVMPADIESFLAALPEQVARNRELATSVEAARSF
jgi:cysteine desulfurase